MPGGTQPVGTIPADGIESPPGIVGVNPPDGVATQWKILCGCDYGAWLYSIQQPYGIQPSYGDPIPQPIRPPYGDHGYGGGGGTSPSGGGGTLVPFPGAGSPPVANLQAFYNEYLAFGILLCAITIWCFSIFLLKQSVQFQKWASRGDDSAPDARSGTLFTIAVTIIVLVSWVLYWTHANYWYLSDMLHDSDPDRMIILLAVMLIPIVVGNPLDFFAVFIILSILPALIAFVKFSLASSMIKVNPSSGDGYMRSSRSPLIGAAASILSLLASAAAIYVSYLVRAHLPN